MQDILCPGLSLTFLKNISVENYCDNNLTYLTLKQKIQIPCNIKLFLFCMLSFKKKLIKHYSQLIRNFRISLPPGSPKNLESVTRTFTAPAKKVTLHLTPRSGPQNSGADPKNIPLGGPRNNFVFPGVGCTMPNFGNFTM